MEYKLNDELSLEYIEKIKIDAINYYKYNVSYLKDQSINKFIYLNKEINLDEIDKDKLSSYIIEKITSLNEENIFANLDEFRLNDKPLISNIGGVKPRASGNINLLNYEDFDKALGLIRGAKECNLTALSNLNTIGTLGGENKNIDIEIYDISTNINKLGNGDDLIALVDNYISTYEVILNGIIEAYAAEQKLKAEAGKLELNQTTLDIDGAENAIKNGLIDYTTKILDGDVKPKTLGEYFGEINTIYNNYSTSSVKDVEDVLNAAKLTEDSKALKDMSEEDKKSYIEAKNKQLDGLYESIKDALNMSRDEFERLLQNDTGKLAEMLSAQSETDVKNRLSGVGDISGVNSFYFEIENLWYSSEAGQQALFEKFKIDSPTKFDDENALAYTEYIKYCMSREHSQDWLREDLRKFSNVVSKIDATGTFSYLSDKEVTKEELEYIESFMAASGGFLPYGYEKVGDTYKRREYIKQGEDMLYYMDYHCGEDVLKKDEDRIITAFSNQGRLDAYERNYKGAWINSQLTGNYSSETQKQVAIDNAERDYNILNGVIEDETRKEQLIDEGHLSFEQLVTFVNNNNIDLKELSNKEYIDKNKETIIKETGLSEAQLYNFAITGTVTPTGYADIDGTMQGTVTLFSSLGITGLQALSGVDKFFENVGDAAKTAVKSDFILNLGIDFDDMGNLYLDLSKNIELTKEFKEYRDSVWEKYLKSELYKEQYEKFKDSASIDKAVKDYYDKYLFDPLTGQYRGLDGKKYYLYEDISDKEKEAIGQKLLPDLFKESKFKEWDLNDSSSSNYYLATFKEGIRNGGDFSSFDDLDSTVIKNAKEQIETINEVSVDKTGTWWNENIYNKDWYNTMETFSFVKKDNILGMTANQIGNMAIPVGLSALGTALGMPALGQVLSSTALFTSAFGGAAEEAFLSGASYNEALGYATLSAGTELVIEKVFSGIAGFGEGWMDEVIDFIPNKAIDAADSLIRNNTGKTDVLKGNVLTQTIKSLITGGIGEGIEEVATDLVTPLWQSLTYMNEKSYGDIVGENVSIESLKQTFLVSFLSSMVFGSSEISQKTNSFNKQMQNLTNEVGNIPGFKEQANKILADIIGYDAQYLTTDIITKTIENNAKQIELNPESQTALKELQQKLTDTYQDLTKNTIELKTKDGSVKLSKELIMNINDIYGFNQKNTFNRNDKVTIDGDKISFKDSKTQQKFISALYDNAKNVVNNQMNQNNAFILKYQDALEMNKKDIVKIEDLNSAIEVLKELGDKSHFSETFGSVTLEINGKEISVPTSVVHEITTKYNLQDGKIVFTEENMNGKEFVSKLLSQVITKLTLKNFSSIGVIQNFNDASKKGDINLLEKASNIIGNNLDTFVVNSTKVDNKDLIKLEVKTNADGEYRSVNIYVDSSTNPTVYLHNDLLAEKIQEIIDKNIGKENIYLGEIVYDKKNDELIVKQNEENKQYVENIKTFMMEENLVIYPYEIVDGTNKTTVNIYLDAQTDTNILENNNIKKKVNEIVENKRKQNRDAKDIYIGKIELKNGQANVTTDRNQKAYVDSKTENIVTTERTNITGTNLIKVEAYVTIEGKTEKVNAYIDSSSNTNLLSKKNAKEKILDMIIEEKKKNGDAKDIYVGEVINDKKSGNVVINQKETTLEQFRSTIIASTIVSNLEGATSATKTKENTKTTRETNNKTTTNREVVTDNLVIDTKNIVNATTLKPEIDKFVENIEKYVKEFVAKYKNDSNFNMKLEELKIQTNIEFNQLIVELTDTINRSYNEIIEVINNKIKTLNENDSQIEKLKSEVNTLTKEREEENKKIREYDTSKIYEIFNTVNTSSDININDVLASSSSINEKTNKTVNESTTRENRTSKVIVSEKINRTIKDNNKQASDIVSNIINDNNAINSLNETYSLIPRTTLLEFIKLDVDSIGKVLVYNQMYSGYLSTSILDSVIELYTHAKENNLDLDINSNLEHFINEYKIASKNTDNELSNLRNALYKKESIISLPTRVEVSSYTRVSVNDIFDIIIGKKNINDTLYSEIDIYEATKELAKYFEGKNVTTAPLIKNAFDIVKTIDENSVIINFIDVLNGKEKIVLPKEIEGEYRKSKISNVLEYLNGKTSFISTGVIEKLKEYIDTNNVQLSSVLKDKINLLASLGEDNIILNEGAYLKGESSPIIVTKYLEGIYTQTSKIYEWIKGESQLYNSYTTDEYIKLIKKFIEYIYSNNIVLDETTLSKLEILRNLKEEETILNLQEFFNGQIANIIDNNISMNGNNFKASTILDVIKLNAKTYLKILSGQNIDGITRENIFDAIEVLYNINPSLKETTHENYENIKSIYNNNYVLDGIYVLPISFNNISTEFIENILNNPTMIRDYTTDERTTLYNAIDEYINYFGENHGKYFEYDRKIKMKNNLIEISDRQIPNVNLTENVYSPLYYLFRNTNENGGTFGTDQGVIREMLKELGIKDAIKALFYNEKVTDDNFLTDLRNMNITKERLAQAFNDLFWNPNRDSVVRLSNIIKNNQEIKLVQKNFPGMNGIEAIRFLYLVETVEAGGNGVCNYAAAVNMIFNKYIGNEIGFEKAFGYPMYVINSEGKKVLNDSMLLVDMYSTINKDVLVKEVDGKYQIATSNNDYLYLTGSGRNIGRFKMENLQKFINEKGIDLALNETFYYTSYDNFMWKEELILKLKETLEKDEYITITGIGFDLLRKDGSIACKDCGGHIMTVVGLTTDGKIIVDSWGQELYIDLETTMNYLGETYEKNGESHTRRLAVASYELTEAITNVENSTNQNNVLNQELEIFATPKGIEMIDESVSNVNGRNITMPLYFEANGRDIFTRSYMKVDIETELLEELVKDSNKFITRLKGVFNIKSSPEILKDGVIKYIDFAKENNIEIQIDKNVQKWYEAVKNAKENNLILTNEYEVIRNGTTPETKTIFDDYIKYNRYGADIKASELLDMIEAKRDITLTPSQFTTALNELSNYINQNGIKLNENITNILNQITNIEQNQVVINPIEVIKGETPIILNKYIGIDGRRVNTLQLIELISNKTDLVNLMNNRIYIEGLQYVDIERAVLELFNISPEMSIQYNEVLNLIKEVKNGYVVFASNNTYAILPKEINGIDTERIFELRTYSPDEMNRIINSQDTETSNKYINAIESIINLVNEKSLQIDISDLTNLQKQLEVPETKHRDVFGFLHKAYSLNQEIGGTYGPEQSAVGVKLSKIGLKSSIETLFKTKMTDIEFFKHLGLDSVTQEKFKKILDKNYRKQNGIFAKMLGNYVNNETTYQEIQKLSDIVKNNIPGLDDKQAFMFLYYMEAGEIGVNGICSYTDAASIIINKYLGDPIKFEQHFGFPMYTINNKGEKIYNYEMLIVDMYSSINKDTLLTIDSETGNLIFESTNAKQTYLGNFGTGLNVDVLNKYFKDKNIELSLNKTFDFNSTKDVMHYEKVLEAIANELQKGNTVHLGAKGFALINEQGDNVANDVGGHAMTVLGINSDGNLVVNSWGKVAIFDLKAELAKTGNEYFDKNVNGNVIEKGTSSFYIQTFETKDVTSSFDGVIELSKNVKINSKAKSESSTELEQELSNNEKHLIFGDGITFRKGISGAHSVEYFMNFFNKTFEEVKRIYSVQGRIPFIQNKIVYLSLNSRVPHPSIEGVYVQKYDYEVRTSKGFEIKRGIKTLVDDKTKLLTWQREAISNSELLTDRKVAFGMSNNGLWFKCYPFNDGNAFPFVEFGEKDIEAITIDNKLKIKVPVLKEGIYITVDVTLDKNTSPIVLEHGPELIDFVQKKVNQNTKLFNETINLGELLFNEESQMIDVSEEYKHSTENVRAKSPRPQIQTENVKQLSILDNIKHTLVKLNDKFTGLKASKLNAESYYDRTTKSNNILFKQKQINKTFRDFLNKHLIDLETLKENGLLKNPKISEINSLITNNRVLTSMIDANVSIADIVGTKKNIDLDKNFNLLFNEGAGEFQTRDLGLLQYTNDQILNVLSESFKTHPIVISEVDTGKYIIEDNGYHRYSILRLHYINEYIKVKDNPELLAELNQKYTIPVKVYKLDTTKTYCTTLLKELGIDVKVKTNLVTKKSNIFIDGKKVNMTDADLIEFTKNKVNNTPNSTQVINRLLSESETFKKFYNENLNKKNSIYNSVKYNKNSSFEMNLDKEAERIKTIVNNYETASIEEIEDIIKFIINKRKQQLNIEFNVEINFNDGGRVLHERTDDGLIQVEIGFGKLGYIKLDKKLDLEIDSKEERKYFVELILQTFHELRHVEQQIMMSNSIIKNQETYKMVREKIISDVFHGFISYNYEQSILEIDAMKRSLKDAFEFFDEMNMDISEDEIFEVMKETELVYLNYNLSDFGTSYDEAIKNFEQLCDKANNINGLADIIKIMPDNMRETLYKECQDLLDIYDDESNYEKKLELLKEMALRIKPELAKEYPSVIEKDYGIDFNTNKIVQNTEIEVNNKTYSIDTIIEILNSKYLEILKGRTIDGINMQNIFTIVNKVFENNPEIKNKYNRDYDNIVDIFKTKYVHENGNLYPKAFNFIKTADISDILKNPYKIQRYSKEKRNQINEAINRYVEYAISNNYDLTPKEYKGYLKVSQLISRDIPNIKLTSEVGSELLNEFRRNALKGGTFGSKQGVIRTLLERNGITNAINYLFNKEATGTKFLEQINDFTDEDFQDLLDNVVDETGRLDGLYSIYDEFELFELMRNNFEGIEDLEIIKFLYLFESIEAGAKGICNYSVAVNMIFNKYLGKEPQFLSDFGYPMYVIKNGKKVLNDMMLLVDMYSTINEEIFTEKVDGVVKVIATNNQDYLPVTNAGGSFNIDNLQIFLNKKGIKLDLNQTFKFDSRTDVMWKEEILSNVKQALQKGQTVNLSAQGFNLYRKDGTLAYEDFGGHAMTVVGLTKDGNLIVDSHGMEMIVKLDSCLENAGKVYIDKNKNTQTRRIGITIYSFGSSIPSSNQNLEIFDVVDNELIKEQDEGIFDVFSKPVGDMDLFKDVLSNNKLNILNESEISSLIENINKGKIKPKEYNLNAETVRILIDKVPHKKIFPISNITAIKSFIDYFGVDTLIEFDKLNNGFLFENKGENIYNLFDFYDLSIPKTNETDKLKELDKLIVDTINSNKKTEYKTYAFNYTGLIGSEFAKIHSELFLDESAPQELKNTFYNGLVNSSNEYKSEWSKYLEGKSIKGIIHEPLVGYENVEYVANINTIGENSSKYNEGLEDLANRVGLSIEQVQEILSSKLKDLIENSEFGVRRTLKSLESILESGKIKNQFEVNHSSYGVSNTDMRMDMERDLFGIPRNIKYEDRPIYGMLLPEDLSSKYVHKGPGAYYSDGSGVIYIFDKSKIMNNATLTLGDSIDQASKICATNLSNPKYFGMFSEILSTIKTKEDLLNFDFRNLYDKTVMEVGNSAYYEFQLHGESSHTLDNLKEIAFLKNPGDKIIKRLEELNIKWRVIEQNNSKKNNSPSIKKENNEQENLKTGNEIYDTDNYFSFKNSKFNSIKQLSVYYGDAGKKVNELFLKGKTIDDILDTLVGLEKIKFQKFLQNTIEGQYLSRLSKDEIRSLTAYTREYYTEINYMLRYKNNFGRIAGMNAKTLIENIDSAISKYNGLEQPMKIYRAVDVGAFTYQNSIYKELFKGIKIYDLKQVYSVLKTLEGKEFSDLGYMSSSPTYRTSFAKNLGCPIVLEIAATKGTKCAYINQLSEFYNTENEILMARNTKLQIVEVLEPKEDIYGLAKIIVKCIVK